MRVFTDGFKHYGDVLRKWASYYAPTGTPVPGGTFNPRRPGASGLVFQATSSAWHYVTSNVLAGLTDRAFAGAACYSSANSSWAITLMSGSTEQVTLKWDGTTGKMSVLRGGVNGTQLAITSAAVGEWGIWNYLEFGAVIHDTAGTVEARFNGAPLSELTLTNQDTKPGSAAGVDSIRLQWNAAFQGAWTDVVVDDTNFLGDVVIDTIFVSGAGAHADFIPNPAGANYQNVDEGTADGDGTYNASSVQGDMDTFAMQNLAAMPTSDILCVSVNLDLRKDDAATRQVKAVIRQGTTDYRHATAIAPSGAFKIHQRCFDTSPDDGLPWEEADVNNAEAGYEQSLVS